MNEVWQNPEVRRRVVAFFTEVGADLARDAFANFGKSRKTDSPPVVTESLSSDCITCTIYQEVALARAYVSDLRDKVTPDGQIPAGLGGTLAQAQNHVEIAMTQLPKVMGLNPKIDEACLKLASLLPDISKRLTWVENGAALDIINMQMEQAGRLAYSIPEAVYRTPEAPEKDKVMYAEVLTPEDYETLKFMRELKNTGGTNDEARLKLMAWLTNPGVSNDEQTGTRRPSNGDSEPSPRPEQSNGSVREESGPNPPH